MRPVLCRPFVGRRTELAYLRERRLEAGASRGGMIFLAGDAGLGKSRLISEFCGSLAYSRWRITSGPCREFGGRPYGPILDALSSVDAEAAQIGAMESKRQYFDAIVERFAKVSARHALIVVLEDLHWADAATLDLLAHLGSKLHRMRMLVIASFRPDALHAGHPVAPALEKAGRAAHAGRIDLAPLEGSELRTFIDEALSGFTLSDERRRAIARTGEGNPFFTEELLKNAVQEGAERHGRSQEARVPHSVRTTLLERLQPFEDVDRRIVTQAAVIGRTFTLEVLATVMEMAPEHLLPALRRARDFQLIEELEPSVFRFRHGLTREAICGDFLRAELRPLHRRIAITLESADARSTEALAYHWWAAGDEAQTTRYNDRAGDDARDVYAYDDAIAYFERALEPRSLPALERGVILEKIANIRLVTSMAEEGRALYGAAADAFAEARAYDREAACRVRVAMTAYTMSLADTSGPLEAMLARLGEDEHLARARLHVGIAWIANALRFPTRAKAHLAKVNPEAMSAATDIRVRYHNVATGVAATLGDEAGFRREHQAWLAAAAAHGVGALAGVYFISAKFFSQFALHDEARAQIREALRIARERRSRHAEECAQATAALCYLLSGELQDARDAVEAVSTTSDNRVNITFATAAGAAIGLHTGDEALVEKWFDGFERTILSAPEIECGQGFADALVRRGRTAEARALLHRILPECELIRGEVPSLLTFARHGSDLDRRRAREYLARASELGESLERPALSLFDAIVVAASDPDEAQRLAAQAAEGFRRFKTPLLEAAARELADQREAALVLYERCGASADVERLRGHRPDLEVAPAQTPAEISLLSAREREIVVLAAAGESNLEIARSLHISHKTVEKHLGSAFQKLGISSRRALRAYVQR